MAATFWRRFLEGEQVAMVARFIDRNVLTGTGTPADPGSVTFRRKLPDLSTVVYTDSDPEVSQLDTGIWQCEVSLDDPGREYWRVEGTDPVQAVSELSILVDPSLI